MSNTVVDKTRLQKFTRVILEKNNIFCSSASLSQKLYFFGIATAIFTIAMRALGFNEGLNLLYFIVFLLSLGLTSDLVNVYKWIWGTLLGKTVVVLSYFVLSNVALAMADRAVNISAQVDFLSPVYTRSIITVVLVPLFAWGVSIAVMTMGFVFLPLIFMFVVTGRDLLSNSCFEPMGKMFSGYLYKSTLAIRVLAFILLFGFLRVESQNLTSGYDDFLEKSIPFLLYELEGNIYTECKLDKSERGIRGEGRQYLIIKEEKEGYKYRKDLCGKN